MGPHSSKTGGSRTSASSQPSSSRISQPLPINFATSNSARKSDLSNFAVITVIFNAVKYKSRYEHYRKFAKHMSNSGVNLITVECIFESTTRFGLPQQNFEVTNAGDHHYIRLVAPSILWMKENLINIAIQRLPSHIEYIAWIDADVEFDRLDWPYLTIDELQRYSIVQIFQLSFFLGPEGKNQILRRDYSFGYSIRHNKVIDPQCYNEWYPHPGYAWAMRRSTFNSIGGLLDFCVIGSADLHFAFSLLHRLKETLRPGLHDDYKDLAIKWGDRVAHVAQDGDNVSYVNVNLWHYWHGERNDRNYIDRWLILERYQFSPQNDLERNDGTGILRLVDKKRFGRPEMAARMEAFERDVVNYFKSRNEDTSVRHSPSRFPSSNMNKRFPPAKHKPNRTGGLKPTPIPSSHWRGSSGPHIWSSGTAGTHVDDDGSYWDQCTCPGNHHHHHGNHDCPCSSDHTSDQNCWNPSEHEQHHQDDCQHDNDYHHHGDWSNSVHDHHNSYGGPGSFY